MRGRRMLRILVATAMATLLVGVVAAPAAARGNTSSSPVAGVTVRVLDYLGENGYGWRKIIVDRAVQAPCATIRFLNGGSDPAAWYWDNWIMRADRTTMSSAQYSQYFEASVVVHPCGDWQGGVPFEYWIAAYIIKPLGTPNQTYYYNI